MAGTDHEPRVEVTYREFEGGRHARRVGMIEPPADEARLSLERAVAEAARARLAAGPRGSVDGDAIALRAVLSGTSLSEKAAVRAVLGRLEAADGIMPVPPGPGTGVTLDRAFLDSVTASREVFGA